MKRIRVKLSALLGGAILVALSCRDASRGVAPQADLVGALPLPSSLPSGLLWCAPLPYDSVTRTIGPEGGTFQVGQHALWVPPGALDTAVTITAVAPSDTVNRVSLQPEGLSFARPAYLTMSYANCNLLGSTLPKRIVYTTDALTILYYLLSVDHPPSLTTTGRLEHFSTYAVAW